MKNQHEHKEEGKEHEFPDQRLFEPDWELEAQEPGKWNYAWRYLRFVAALSVVIGLLYLSGVYQALLLRQTPESIRQDPIPPRFEAEEITIPVSVFLLTSDTSTFGTRRDRNNAGQIIQKASNIWSQASVELSLVALQTVEVSESDIRRFNRDPHQYVRSVSGYDNRHINIFLTGTLSGLNGVAFSGTESLAVADAVSHYDFRTLAHEIGHVLGLGHTQSQRSLMTQGAYGTEISVDEIERARIEAERFR